MAGTLTVKDHCATHQCYVSGAVASQFAARAVIVQLIPGYFEADVPGISSQFWQSLARFNAGDEAIALWFLDG